MPPNWLDELERLEKAATPAPWRCDYRGDGSGTVRIEEDLADALLDDAHCPYIRGEVCYEDGQLAASLRNAAARLLAVARAAQECVRASDEEDLEAALAKLFAALEGK